MFAISTVIDPRGHNSNSSLSLNIRLPSVSKLKSFRPAWGILPAPVLSVCSTFLAPEEVARHSRVSKAWNKALNQKQVWEKQCEIQGYDPTIYLNCKEIFKIPIPNEFNAQDYARYFRKKVVGSPRPPDMRKINNTEDPDRAGKKIKETHVWIYNPGGLSLSGIKKNVKRPYNGYPTKHSHCLCDDDNYGQFTRTKGWFLISKTILMSTEEILRSKKEAGYKIPWMMEAALAASVWYVKTRECLFNDTFTTTCDVDSFYVGAWLEYDLDMEMDGVKINKIKVFWVLSNFYAAVPVGIAYLRRF